MKKTALKSALIFNSPPADHFLKLEVATQDKSVKKVVVKDGVYYILTGEGEIWKTDISSRDHFATERFSLLTNISDSSIRELSRTSIVEIATNDTVILALTSHGEVYSWGSDPCNYGLLGLSTVQKIEAPRRIINLSQIKQISISSKHAAAVDGNGGLYTWGTGVKGELCHSNKSFVDEPLSVKSHTILSCKNVVCYKTITGVVTTGGHIALYGSLTEENSSDRILNGQREILNLPNTFFTSLYFGKGFAVVLTKNQEVYLISESFFCQKLDFSSKFQSIAVKEQRIYGISDDGKLLVEWEYTKRSSPSKLPEARTFISDQATRLIQVTTLSEEYQKDAHFQPSQEVGDVTLLTGSSGYSGHFQAKQNLSNNDKISVRYQWISELGKKGRLKSPDVSISKIFDINSVLPSKRVQSPTNGSFLNSSFNQTTKTNTSSFLENQDKNFTTEVKSPKQKYSNFFKEKDAKEVLLKEIAEEPSNKKLSYKPNRLERTSLNALVSIISPGPQTVTDEKNEKNSDTREEIILESQKKLSHIKDQLRNSRAERESANSSLSVPKGLKDLMSSKTPTPKETSKLSSKNNELASLISQTKAAAQVDKKNDKKPSSFLTRPEDSFQSKSGSPSMPSSTKSTNQQKSKFIFTEGSCGLSGLQSNRQAIDWDRLLSPVHRNSLPQQPNQDDDLQLLSEQVQKKTELKSEQKYSLSQQINQKLGKTNIKKDYSYLSELRSPKSVKPSYLSGISKDIRYEEKLAEIPSKTEAWLENSDIDVDFDARKTEANYSPHIMLEDQLDSNNNKLSEKMVYRHPHQLVKPGFEDNGQVSVQAKAKIRVTSYLGDAFEEKNKREEKDIGLELDSKFMKIDRISPINHIESYKDVDRSNMYSALSNIITSRRTKTSLVDQEENRKNNSRNQNEFNSEDELPEKKETDKESLKKNIQHGKSERKPSIEVSIGDQNGKKDNKDLEEILQKKEQKKNSLLDLLKRDSPKMETQDMLQINKKSEEKIKRAALPLEDDHSQEENIEKKDPKSSDKAKTEDSLSLANQESSSEKDENKQMKAQGSDESQKVEINHIEETHKTSIANIEGLEKVVVDSFQDISDPVEGISSGKIFTLADYSSPKPSNEAHLSFRYPEIRKLDVPFGNEVETPTANVYGSKLSTGRFVVNRDDFQLKIRTSSSLNGEKESAKVNDALKWEKERKMLSIANMLIRKVDKTLYRCLMALQSYTPDIPETPEAPQREQREPLQLFKLVEVRAEFEGSRIEEEKVMNALIQDSQRSYTEFEPGDNYDRLSATISIHTLLEKNLNTMKAKVFRVLQEFNMEGQQVDDAKSNALSILCNFVERQNRDSLLKAFQNLSLNAYTEIKKERIIYSVDGLTQLLEVINRRLYLKTSFDQIHYQAKKTQLIEFLFDFIQRKMQNTNKTLKSIAFDKIKILVQERKQRYTNFANYLYQKFMLSHKGALAHSFNAIRAYSKQKQTKYINLVSNQKSFVHLAFEKLSLSFQRETLRAISSYAKACGKRRPRSVNVSFSIVLKSLYIRSLKRCFDDLKEHSIKKNIKNKYLEEVLLKNLCNIVQKNIAKNYKEAFEKLRINMVIDNSRRAKEREFKATLMLSKLTSLFKQRKTMGLYALKHTTNNKLRNKNKRLFILYFKNLVENLRRKTMLTGFEMIKEVYMERKIKAEAHEESKEDLLVLTDQEKLGSEGFEEVEYSSFDGCSKIEKDNEKRFETEAHDFRKSISLFRQNTVGTDMSKSPKSPKYLGRGRSVGTDKSGLLWSPERQSVSKEKLFDFGNKEDSEDKSNKKQKKDGKNEDEKDASKATNKTGEKSRIKEEKKKEDKPVKTKLEKIESASKEKNTAGGKAIKVEPGKITEGKEQQKAGKGGKNPLLKHIEENKILRLSKSAAVSPRTNGIILEKNVSAKKAQTKK